MTGRLGHRNRGPIHTLNMTFNTSIFPFNFWTRMTPGVTVKIKYDFGFHGVDSNYILLGYSATINSQGDEIITPDFERVLPYTG
jgi:hypothetical protein